MGSINRLKSLLMVVAEMVLSNSDDRAKAAGDVFLSITELRSYLDTERHSPR